ATAAGTGRRPQPRRRSFRHGQHGSTARRTLAACRMGSTRRASPRMNGTWCWAATGCACSARSSQP
ncbi:uncharacterized protein METZ01_LOCUS506433, partial [marine metagenome]